MCTYVWSVHRKWIFEHLSCIFQAVGAFGAHERARYQTYSQERYQTALKNIKAISVPTDFCGRSSQNVFSGT